MVETPRGRSPNVEKRNMIGYTAGWYVKQFGGRDNQEQGREESGGEVGGTGKREGESGLSVRGCRRKTGSG